MYLVYELGTNAFLCLDMKGESNVLPRVLLKMQDEA